MRHSLKKAAAVAFLVFLAIWVAETVYALSQPYPPPAPVWTDPSYQKFDNRILLAIRPQTIAQPTPD